MFVCLCRERERNTSISDIMIKQITRFEWSTPQHSGQGTRNNYIQLTPQKFLLLMPHSSCSNSVISMKPLSKFNQNSQSPKTAF